MHMRMHTRAHAAHEATSAPLQALELQGVVEAGVPSCAANGAGGRGHAP